MIPNLQERLGREPDPLIQEFYGEPHIHAELGDLGHHLAAHRAHLVMLAEQGIVTAEHARAIAAALERLEAQGAGAIPIRPELNDLVSCTEAWLIGELGEDVGGRLHIGRSRNDLALTLARLVTREELHALRTDVVAMRDVLLRRAGEHTETIVPGYTHHSQQAQPVTFGHFLLGHHDALARDLERLNAAAARMDRSPLGAAALAGTGFPVDRERVADLLGFAEVAEHTADACGSRDFQLEVAAAAAILLQTLSRLAESLILYASAEFGFVELDDACASISSIMPQKKNPVALEIVEAQLARATGHLTTLLVALKSTTLGMSREQVYCDGEVEAVLREARYAVRITARVVEGLAVDAERALELVESSTSTTTELADALVRDHGLSFRQAHRVVGACVARALADGAPIDASLVCAVAGELLDIGLAVSADEVHRALDARAHVATRDTRGGPAPAEVRRMIGDREQALAAAARELAGEEERRGAAQQRLTKAVEQWT
jgi:argininosuccinate lyase